MKSVSLFGTTAMAGASALRVAIQVAILPIVAHILGPKAYGQVALVSPFVFFALLLAESGFGTCIVRADKVTKELEGTIFCFSTALSLLIIVLFGACSYPIGKLVHEPLFPALLMGMSSILLFASMTIVPAALLLRNKRYDYIALSDVASSIGSIIGVTLGIYLDWGVWSLVVQQIFLWIAKATVVMIAAHWRPSLYFSRTLLKEQILFGSRLTASGILSFIARNIDNVLIGAFMGSQVLGFYALAFQIVGLPAAIISGSVYFTVLSQTSEAMRVGTFTSEFFLKTLRSISIIGIPVCIGLALTAPFSVPIFLGDKWLPMITLIYLLTPLGLQQIITSMTAGVIIGLGHADLVFKLGLVSSTSTVIAIIAGVAFNSNAVAIGVSCAAILTCLLHLWTVKKECNIRISVIAYYLYAPFMSAIVMSAIVCGLIHFLPSHVSLILKLLASVLCGSASYLAILYFFFHDHVATDIATLQSAISSRLFASEQR